MTLSLVTFVAFGASWQLVAVAGGESRARETVTARVQPLARGLLPQTSSFDTSALRATASGLALALGGGVTVSVVDGGLTRVFRAPRGATVAEALQLAGVALGSLDRVRPEAGAPLDSGASVTVARVAETTAVVQEELPFGRRDVATASLPWGRVLVAAAGSPGLAENTYKVTTVDGTEESRELVTSVELVAPAPQVRWIGTALPGAPGDVQAIITAAAERWGADPAQLLRVSYCESRYDPYAYNAGSGASGLFQFLPRTWAANSARAGYSGTSAFDAVANANTAAMMFANGQAGQWVCR